MNGHFVTWFLTGWQLCCQPITNQFRKIMVLDRDFIWDPVSNTWIICVLLHHIVYFAYAHTDTHVGHIFAYIESWQPLERWENESCSLYSSVYCVIISFYLELNRRWFSQWLSPRQVTSQCQTSPKLFRNIRANLDCAAEVLWGVGIQAS